MMVIEFSRHMRGSNGQWFTHSAPFLRTFKDIEEGVVWAKAELRGLHGHRIDLRINDHMAATVYSDGQVSRFGDGDDAVA